MKKSFVAASLGVLTGATLLFGGAPAMAHDRIGFGISVGLPIVAPVAYAAPAPYYAPVPYYAPAPVVYGYGYRARFGAPYYYHDRGWHDFRGHREWHR